MCLKYKALKSYDRNELNSFWEQYFYIGDNKFIVVWHKIKDRPWFYDELDNVIIIPDTRDKITQCIDEYLKLYTEDGKCKSDAISYKIKNFFKRIFNID